MDNRPKASALDYQSMRSSVEQFTMALQKGNIPKMLELLKADSVFISDGGGKVKAALIPIHTSERIVLLFTSIMKKLPENARLDFEVVNGYPGVVVSINGKVAYVVSIEFKNDKIWRIFMVSNPDKLEHLQK